MGSIVCPPDPYIRIPNKKSKMYCFNFNYFFSLCCPFPQNSVKYSDEERGKGTVSTTNHL